MSKIRPECFDPETFDRSVADDVLVRREEPDEEEEDEADDNEEDEEDDEKEDEEDEGYSE